MAESKDDKKSKIKKKRWYPIIAPKLLKEVVLGETTVAEPELMLKKAITVNLMTITNDPKKQNINVKFVINEVTGNRALTEMVGFEIIPASLKRLIRKGKKKIDISFVCETSDKKRVRIKPLFLIRNTTKGSTESALRKYTIDFLTKTISKVTYDELINLLISHKIQESLRAAVKRIYPLKISEIRYMGVEHGSPLTPVIPMEEEPASETDEDNFEEQEEKESKKKKPQEEESEEEPSEEKTEEASKEEDSEDTTENSE